MVEIQEDARARAEIRVDPYRNADYGELTIQHPVSDPKGQTVMKRPNALDETGSTETGNSKHTHCVRGPGKPP